MMTKIDYKCDGQELSRSVGVEETYLIGNIKESQACLQSYMSHYVLKESGVKPLCSIRKTHVLSIIQNSF